MQDLLSDHSFSAVIYKFTGGKMAVGVCHTCHIAAFIHLFHIQFHIAIKCDAGRMSDRLP